MSLGGTVEKCSLELGGREIFKHLYNKYPVSSCLQGINKSYNYEKYTTNINVVFITKFIFKRSI